MNGEFFIPSSFNTKSYFIGEYLIRFHPIYKLIDVFFALVIFFLQQMSIVLILYLLAYFLFFDHFSHFYFVLFCNPSHF